MKDLQDKQEFADKNKGNTTFLKSQSTQNYRLYRDNENNLYFIRRQKDKKTVNLGDKEQAENYILDGLNQYTEEIKELFK